MANSDFIFLEHITRLTETRLNMLKIALQKAENLEPYHNLNLQWFRMKL